MYPATEAESEVGAGDLGKAGAAAVEVLVDWAAALLDCRAVYTYALPPSPILRTMVKSERLPIAIFLPFFRFEMSPILPPIVDGNRDVGGGMRDVETPVRANATQSGAEVLEK